MRALAAAGSVVTLAAALLLPAAPPQAQPGRADTAPAPTSHATATGRLVSYDEAARALVVQTALGRTTYLVAEDARAWLGTRRLALDHLVRHLGAQATVAYREVGGLRVTHTVRLRERGNGEP